MRRKTKKGEKRKYHRLGSVDLYAAMQRVMLQKNLYLDKNCSRDILARELMTNRTYVSRALNSRGMSCTQFVNSFRVQRAISLLERSDMAEMPLADIAELSGFSGVDAMSRYIKKSAGQTARALRKRFAKEGD